MAAPLSYEVLCRENATFCNTAGVSQANRGAGFHPAFYDTLKRTADIARFRDGSPAPCHILDGVPDDWVLQRDQFGRVIRVRPSIVSGFMRNGRFYTREQAMRICSQWRQAQRPQTQLAGVPKRPNHRHHATSAVRLHMEMPRTHRR